MIEVMASHHFENNGFAPVQHQAIIWTNVNQDAWRHTGITESELTHWGQDKMAAFSQMTSLNAFFLIKMYEFRITFH